MITTTELLRLPAAELDVLYATATARELPTGVARGTALAATATRLSRPLSALVGMGLWKGKDFADEGTSLTNIVSPFGVRAIKADVWLGTSRLDDRPCVVLDYSRTSLVARCVRDEIREVAPGLYLGVVFVRSRRAPLRFVLEFASAEPSPGTVSQWADSVSAT